MQNDPQELSRRFNEDEAIWRRYRAIRLKCLLLRRRRGWTDEEFERLVWAKAEAEARLTRCIGIEVP